MVDITQFDYFRFIPSKVIYQTKIGALLSLTFLLFIFYFLKQEIPLFWASELKTEILFENLYFQDLPVYIDIDIFNLPCDILSFQFSSKKELKDTMQKFRLIKDQNNQIITVEKFNSRHEISKIRKSLEYNEGCKFKGFFNMHLAANTFNIDFGEKVTLKSLMQIYKKQENFSLDHKINKLYFNREDNFEIYEKYYNLTGFRILDGYTVKGKIDEGVKHTYFINIVPNLFDRSFYRFRQLFQFTASHYYKKSGNIGIFFM